MVIPNFVRQGLSGAPITVFGDGSQSRCFGHVKDVVRALADLMTKEQAYGQVYNIGNDEEVTILQLAERVRELTGRRSDIVRIPYDQAYEAGFEDMVRRVPNLKKIKSFLGWRPTANLDQILGDVIGSMKA
jgi:UDP-glucose 4-epimerase